MSGTHKEILLVEPSMLTGSIIVSTARQLHLPEVRQVASVRSAQQQLAQRDYAGVIVSLEEQKEALELLEQVRNAQLAVAASVPVAVTTAQVDAQTADQMRALRVRRVLLKPFKVKDVISTIELLKNT